MCSCSGSVIEVAQKVREKRPKRMPLEIAPPWLTHPEVIKRRVGRRLRGVGGLETSFIRMKKPLSERRD